MGKIKKVVSAVGSVATNTVEATTKESNNLLLLVLIVIVWLYLFFNKGSGN